MNTNCPFCKIDPATAVASNDLALAIFDNFPVSPGHMLFVPRRHVASWFDATEEEQIAIMRLINKVKHEVVPSGAWPAIAMRRREALAKQDKPNSKVQDRAILHSSAEAERRRTDVRRHTEHEHPDGFNIGINIGIPAGQTVMHLHVHLIPRYEGDVDDPRGGVRLVLPGKAKYWE